MKLQGIKAVTFDAGGTLLEPFPSVGHVYSLVAHQLYGIDLDPDELTRRFLQAWKKKSNFRYSLECWRWVVVETFRGLMPVIDNHFFQALYVRFEDPAVWRVYDDVLPTLEKLRDRGLPLAIISNWDERLGPLLTHLKLAQFFSSVQISGKVGFHKPAPEIYLAATTELNIRPEEALHVGDSNSEDYEGAMRCGLRAVLLNREAAESQPHVIRSLAELLE
jgi:putative hydrolase of the HAD superfamily